MMWTVTTVIESHAYTYNFEGRLLSEEYGRYVFVKDDGKVLRVSISRTVAVSEEIKEDGKKEN